MYDAREKAIRDRRWELNSAIQDGEARGEERGEARGEVKLIRTLQPLLNLPLGDEQELLAMPLEQLRILSAYLQEQLRGRDSK